MTIEKVINEKPVTITNNGMITIPAALRRKYNLKDGDKIYVIEDEGTLRIIPIVPLEELKKFSYKSEEMNAEMEQSRKEELEREY